MIIIERYWQEDNPSGGCKLLSYVKRKAFSDNDVEGVEKFINENAPIIGYKWKNIEYKYIKL